MDLSEIEAFVTITRAGGFTRAAGRLHLSQPAISRRIELLERELGAPLFERLAGGIRLTAAGESFLPYAQQVLAALEDGKAAPSFLRASPATLMLQIPHGLLGRFECLGGQTGGKGAQPFQRPIDAPLPQRR